MPPHLFGCGSAALWFAFSVPSMSCPMWGRLSSRPWPPLPTALPHPIAAAKWSKPPRLPHRLSLWSKPRGLPCRPLRGARSLACHTGSHAGGRLVRLSHPYSGAGTLMCGSLSLWGHTVIAGLRKFAALISEDSRESCGKSRSRHYRTETFNQRQCGQCMSNAARANSRLRTH